MKILTVLALSASMALAAPSSPSSPSTPSTPSSPSSKPLVHEKASASTTSDCTPAAISECVASLKLDGIACFAHVCTTTRTAELRRRQTSNETTAQEDDGFKVASANDTPASCTEDNLLDCAVAQWRNPDVCFQQLCL